MTTDFHPDLTALHRLSAGTARKAEQHLSQATYEAIMRADPSIDTWPTARRSNLVPDAYATTQTVAAPAALGLMASLRRYVLG